MQAVIEYRRAKTVFHSCAWPGSCPGIGAAVVSYSAVRCVVLAVTRAQSGKMMIQFWEWLASLGAQAPNSVWRGVVILVLVVSLLMDLLGLWFGTGLNPLGSVPIIRACLGSVIQGLINPNFCLVSVVGWDIGQ